MSIRMVEFELRSIENQRQIWLDVAAQALKRWGIAPTKTRWLGHGSNVVFRVTAGGIDYVLRLHPPGSVDGSQLESELRWLRSIRRDTDLLAPFPVGALVNGREQLFVEMHQDLLPPPSIAHAALFEYIDGESKQARDLSPHDVYQIGAFLGALHTDAQPNAASDFDRPRLDWEGLFGEDSPYAVPSASALVSAEQRGVLQEVAQRLREPLLQLASRSEAAGLIHADLLAKNIVFRADSIVALDFEYCAWGLFLYDLAPLLWQLKGERAGDYHLLEEAVWRGYTSIRPAAEDDRALLEPFIAARQWASIGWLLANQRNPTVRDLAPALITERCGELKVFLDTGILRRSTPTL